MGQEERKNKSVCCVLSLMCAVKNIPIQFHLFAFLYNKMNASSSGAQSGDDEITKRRKKAIREAFRIFDKEEKNTVDEAEIPCIMNYLGYFPSRKDVLYDVIPFMEEDEPASAVKLEKFEQKMLQIMEEGEYLPSSEEQLLSAFKQLDPNGKGYVAASYLESLMQSEGTPFVPKELENMMATFKDMDTGNFYYEDYIAKLIEDNVKYSCQ